MLSDFLTENESSSNQFYEDKIGILKVRGKTLIFGNVVYQIHNISSIGLVNRTSIRKFPKFLWFLLAVGLVCLSVTNWQVQALGAIIIVFFIWQFYKYQRNKLREKYGLTIYTNGGNKSIFYSKKEDYIKKVMLVLYQIMNNDNEKLNAFTFNFENCSVDQSKVEIGTNIGSPFSGGQVHGELVNNV